MGAGCEVTGLLRSGATAVGVDGDELLRVPVAKIAARNRAVIRRAIRSRTAWDMRSLCSVLVRTQ
jgi:hypothetical protein